jgi:hypothetical protein
VSRFSDRLSSNQTILPETSGGRASSGRRIRRRILYAQIQNFLVGLVLTLEVLAWRCGSPGIF